MGHPALPPVLRHATRSSFLPSIRAEGLRRRFYGRIHGAMEYRPLAPSLYLSRHPASSNLNTALFDDPADPVVVLDIATDGFDPECMSPDDAFFTLLERKFLPDPDLPSDGPDFADAAAAFGQHFGLSSQRAFDLLATFHEAEESTWPILAQPLWPEYLMVEGEIAYAGDIPAETIRAVRPWSDV